MFYRLTIFLKLTLLVYDIFFLVKLEVSSVGTGLVTIKGVQSGRYLAMNSAGYLFSSVRTDFDSSLYLILVLY
jgi:hypothetical protein